MNKAELIESLTGQLGNKATAKKAVEAVVDTITRAVAKGEKVAITGFGVFERQTRPARTVRNPATGASIKKKKTNVPRFRAGAGFKDVVSGAKKAPAPAKATAATSTGRASTRKSAAASGTAGTRKATTRKAAGTKSAASKSTTSRGTTKRAAAKKSTTRATTKATTSRGAAKKTTAKKTATKRSTARKR